MNTTFHMDGIQHAYSSLALTSHGTTLHARIGSRCLEIRMGCPQALAAAMRQLRQRVIVTADDVIQICGDTQAGSVVAQASLHQPHH